MKKIGVGLVIFTLLLVGCRSGGSKEETIVCTMDNWSDTSVLVDIRAEGDLITALTAFYTSDLEVELSEEEQNQVIEALEEEYGNYGGMSLDYSFYETELDIMMDFNLDNLDDLPSSLEGFVGNKIKGKSSTSFVKGLEDYGYSCEVE